MIRSSSGMKSPWVYHPSKRDMRWSWYVVSTPGFHSETFAPGCLDPSSRQELGRMLGHRVHCRCATLGFGLPRAASLGQIGKVAINTLLKAYLDLFLPAHCLAVNSTEGFRDLAPYEVKWVQAPNKGRLLKRAGLWALDETTRQQRNKAEQGRSTKLLADHTAIMGKGPLPALLTNLDLDKCFSSPSFDSATYKYWLEQELHTN